MQPYLSEYDFSVARSCLTKLYYKKKGYPTNNSISKYNQCLTDSSFTIYALALASFPEGRFIRCGMDIDRGIAETREALHQEEVSLFEPVIYAGNKVARPSIVIKQGGLYQLIRITTKTAHSQETFRSKRDGRIQSAWLPLFQSIAFQTYILQEMFPEEKIHAYLLMPDRDYRAPIDDLNKGFTISQIAEPEILSRLSGVQFSFSGDRQLLELLHLIDVTTAVSEVITRIAEEVDFLAAYLQESPSKVITPIDKHCKQCEFKRNRLDQSADQRDGFKECWGELADITPHIFDLYHATRLYDGTQSIVDRLLTEGKASLLDVPWQYIENTVHGYRQRIQILCTRANREWISDQLLEIIDRFVYPLYFIDFETARVAIPPKVNCHPYTQIAFQWSCHKIESPGAIPQHYSWLNLDELYPNEAFAIALQECLGEQGTIFTWGMHENGILRDIYYQLRHLGTNSLELLEWLSAIAKTSQRSTLRFVDMHGLTLKYYFHPLMKGRTSLKCVLPAIWQTSTYLHDIPWLQEYYQSTENGVENPYRTLGKHLVSDRQWVIQEGMEAALAYQEIHYGTDQNNPNWRSLLEQYCRLDTMAMVIIWLHWQHLFAVV